MTSACLQGSSLGVLLSASSEMVTACGGCGDLSPGTFLLFNVTPWGAQRGLKILCPLPGSSCPTC